MIQDKTKKSFIFCDDSDDRFEQHYSLDMDLYPPEGLSKKDYITWASIIVNTCDFNEVICDMEYLKSQWSIPKFHFSGNDGEKISKGTSFK